MSSLEGRSHCERRDTFGKFMPALWHLHSWDSASPAQCWGWGVGSICFQVLSNPSGSGLWSSGLSYSLYHWIMFFVWAVMALVHIGSGVLVGSWGTSFSAVAPGLMRKLSGWGSSGFSAALLWCGNWRCTCGAVQKHYCCWYNAFF